MHPRHTVLWSAGLFLGAVLLAPAPAATAAGIDPAGMDLSVKPYVDFYEFANGKWLARTKIPADRARIITFTLLQDRNREVLRQILEKAAKNTAAPKGSSTAKVGAFFKSGMDEKSIERAGAHPLQEEFDRIEKIENPEGLGRIIARLQERGVSVGFRMGPRPDLKNSKQMIAKMTQGGLGLPDRDYYLKTDAKTKAIREAYQAHIQKMFELLGDEADRAADAARRILELETRLAKASKTRVALRDPKANYHVLTLKKLEEAAPGFPWKAYFVRLRLHELETVDVGQPAFFHEIGALAAEVPLSTWKTYLRWHLLNAYADKLSPAFVKEDFHFKGTVLTGVPQMRPRWERVLEAADDLLGDALGQLYVATAFPPEARAKALALVHTVKMTLRERLATLDWMSPATREAAVRKLDAITVKIGYPDKWRDYSGLALDQKVYVVNVLEARRFARRQELAKIGKPVDRTEWHMTPPTVNAYYNPSQNEIVFPAGILQPPFFDPAADDAVNYGAIGMVIGHELTHGFDDQGRKFDADGNLHDWWTPADERTYKERAALIAAQYDGYVAVDDLHINGKLTLGENIADLGGLRIAYLAFHRTLQGKATPAKIDGFTADQRFFLSYAQLWRAKVRPEAARVRIATDPHSPPRFRVLGPLFNLPEFFEAFGATPEQAGKRLNPTPVKIW